MKLTVRRALAALCSSALIVSAVPMPVAADTSDELQVQLDAARSELNSLYEEAELANEQLNKTRYELKQTSDQIDELNKQIADQEDNLGEAQDNLGKTVSASYKQGPLSLLDIVLSSTSFEDFINRLAYAERVSAAYSRQIDDVKTIKTELAASKDSLEEHKATQEQLLKQQEADAAELEDAAGAAEDYVASLSTQVQEALAAEAAARAEAERKAAEEAAAAAAANNNNYLAAAEQVAAANGGQASSQTQDTPSASTDSSSNSSSSSSSGSQSSSSSASGLSHADARNTIVAYVLAQVGKPYVWGTSGPDSFDCSGLTAAAYEQVGIEISHWDGGQVQYCNKPASEAVAGDIVWRSGHVGICVGGGVTVEAHTPATGIGWGSVDNFARSGSPLDFQ